MAKSRYVYPPTSTFGKAVAMGAGFGAGMIGGMAADSNILAGIAIGAVGGGVVAGTRNIVQAVKYGNAASRKAKHLEEIEQRKAQAKKHDALGPQFDNL